MTPNFHIVEKNCEVCGRRLILRNNRDILRKRFCSRSCGRVFVGRILLANNMMRRSVRVCPTCHKKLSTCPSLNKKYCSMACWRNRPVKIWIEQGYAKTTDRDTGRVRVAQHTLIAEKVLGRRLRKGEIVHHINLNKADNRNCNLLICDTKYHQWLHHQYQLRYVELYLR